MSDVKLVLNNNINLSNTYSNLVEASGTYANFYEIIPDGFSAGASSIQFQNIVVPNLSTTVVSRNMRLRYQLNVTYNQNAINKIKDCNEKYSEGLQLNGCQCRILLLFGGKPWL